MTNATQPPSAAVSPLSNWKGDRDGDLETELMHASMSCVMVQGAGQAPRGGSVLCEPSPTRQACPSPGPESPRSPESRGLHLGSRRADWEGGQEEVAGGSGDVPPDPVLLGLPGGPMLLLLWGAAPRPHPADPRGARPTHPPPAPPPTLTKLPLADIGPGGSSENEFWVFHYFLEEQRRSCDCNV